jgi:DNA-binding NtrC family response regulator
MRSDISNLKNAVQSILKGGRLNETQESPEGTIIHHNSSAEADSLPTSIEKDNKIIASEETLDVESAEDPNGNLSLQDLEVEMIKRAIDKHRGRRKEAAEELGISERTLYRKIKQYNLG